ncbi:MAG TPA: 5-formyltetrahydrofolate cyclo-ligase [Bdellovibrionota bacterium]|jgi:5-formyltetrahydrofolate cyclo-ligase|nr:5-formyltetrahydrofolate cyclo-ligase [Bdellovibrionota bacterium]
MNDIRKELRRSLASIPESAVLSEPVKTRLIEDLRAHGPESTLGIYYPLSRWKEISMLFLENEFAGRCAFPKIAAGEMKFYLASSSELTANREFPELKEPAGEATREVHPEVIFAPATACDRQGQRIGKGGGYYDRYLNQNPEAIAIGVIDDSCLYSAFEPEWVQAHDHPVAFVLTQSQYFHTEGATKK